MSNPLATYMRKLIDRAKVKHAETLRQFGADPAEVYGAVENEPVISWDGDGCSIRFISLHESMRWLSQLFWNEHGHLAQRRT